MKRRAPGWQLLWHPKHSRTLADGRHQTSNNPQAALDPLNQALSLTIQTDNQESKAL
jgi:hypothetical protein